MKQQKLVKFPIIPVLSFFKFFDKKEKNIQKHIMLSSSANFLLLVYLEIFPFSIHFSLNFHQNQ